MGWSRWLRRGMLMRRIDFAKSSACHASGLDIGDERSKVRYAHAHPDLLPAATGLHRPGATSVRLAGVGAGLDSTMLIPSFVDAAHSARACPSTARRPPSTAVGRLRYHAGMFGLDTVVVLPGRARDRAR